MPQPNSINPMPDSLPEAAPIFVLPVRLKRLDLDDGFLAIRMPTQEITALMTFGITKLSRDNSRVGVFLPKFNYLIATLSEVGWPGNSSPGCSRGLPFQSLGR
jgi:hypothetical protein